MVFGQAAYAPEMHFLAMFDHEPLIDAHIVDVRVVEAGHIGTRVD